MGKTAACISMLQILNSERIYKVSELADLLETNPRNVVEHKRELELMGYNVLSIPGRYGGYQLEKSSLNSTLRELINPFKKVKIKAIASRYIEMIKDYSDTDRIEEYSEDAINEMNIFL